jgi:adenine phosphoribosyltransferase
MSTEFDLEKYIHNIPDFPKEGVIFKDISPLLKFKLNETVDLMAKDVNWDQVDHIIGIESRGFILGSAMAARLNKGFIPIRKKGKLPPPVLSQKYDLEYGQDQLELHPNDLPANVVIVDDVLATGGTMKAAINLCHKASYTIQHILVLIDLKF